MLIFLVKNKTTMTSKVQLTLGEKHFALQDGESKLFGVIHDFMEDSQTTELDFPVDNIHGVSENIIEGLFAMIRAPDMEDWFKDKKTTEICKVMTFANFMGMDKPEKNVLDSCAKEIANRIRGKSSEEIREIFTD